ncbi:MAG: hypothetical protein IIY65_01585 [Erysipelotrichaceae bacterium]|nr:hypothetical protein [Erysipelotrichaceae bacterium]
MKETAEPAKEEAAEPVEEKAAEKAEEEKTEDVKTEAVEEAKEVTELPAKETENVSESEKADENAEAEEAEEVTYVIYFEASDNGLVLVDGNDPIKKETKTKQEVKKAEEIKAVTAEANEGFEFEEWQLNGATFSKEATLSAGQIELKDQDRYTALFKEVVEEAEKEEIPESEEIKETEEEKEAEIFKIYFEAAEHGTIIAEAEGAEAAAAFYVEAEKAEDLVSVTANAEEGYEFAEWQKNGEHFS